MVFLSGNLEESDNFRDKSAVRMLISEETSEGLVLLFPHQYENTF